MNELKVNLNLNGDTNQVAHITGKMQRVDSLVGVDLNDADFISKLDDLGVDSKGRKVKKALIYAVGPHFITGVDSVCIAQAHVNTFGRVFHNSETFNPFEPTIRDFTDNKELSEEKMNIRWRYGFVLKGNMMDPILAQKHLDESSAYIRSSYSNDIDLLLTKEQKWHVKSIFDKMVAEGASEEVAGKYVAEYFAKLKDKMIIRDKDKNAVLDTKDRKVYRANFVVPSICDDRFFTDITWKGSKSIAVGSQEEVIKSLVKQ